MSGRSIGSRGPQQMVHCGPERRPHHAASHLDKARQHRRGRNRQQRDCTLYQPGVADGRLDRQRATERPCGVLGALTASNADQMSQVSPSRRRPADAGQDSTEASEAEPHPARHAGRSEAEPR
jgi:hypothetical protein